jgi:amidase
MIWRGSDAGDPAGWSATEIAAAVRERTANAREILAAHHRRAEQQPGLGALVSPNWDSAFEEAERLDRAVALGHQVGPLAGVPFTVKDVITASGLPTTGGSVALRDNMPRYEATAVSRLRAAGAILIGKSNCPEFAFGTTCDSPLFGVTGNPIAEDRSPGGSSGGEAACLASGISALGLGTDYGGSLRWPAQCTGIVALRPTPGRIPGTGQIPGAGGELGDTAPPLPSPASVQGRMQVIGPLARTIDDLELALRVAGGSDDLDPASVDAPLSGVVDKGALRIAWSDGTHIGPVRREISNLVGELAGALADKGEKVTEVGELFAGCLEAYNRLRALDPLTDHLLAISGRERDFSPFTLHALRGMSETDPRERTLAWRDAVGARARGLEVFQRFDVALLPVAGGPACWPDGSVDIDGTRVDGWELMAHCRAVTLLGAPTVSVPIGLSAEGLPLSVQVVAAPWREDIALAFAAHIFG